MIPPVSLEAFEESVLFSHSFNLRICIDINIHTTEGRN